MGIATVNTESQGAVSTTSGSSGGVCMGGVLARRCRRPSCVGLLDILMTFTREVRFARHLEEWSCIRSPQRIYPANVAAVGSTPLCRAGGCTLILMQGLGAQFPRPYFIVAGTIGSGSN